MSLKNLMLTQKAATGNTVIPETAITGVQVAKLLDPAGGGSQFFGHAMAISGDGKLAFVTSPYDDDRGAETGSITVLEKVAGVWTNRGKILSSSGYNNGEHLGMSIATNYTGSVIVVGAENDTVTASNQGSAYIFERPANADGYAAATWVQLEVIVPTVRANSLCGCSVGMSDSGDAIVIGAYSDVSTANVVSGAAYIYTRSGAGFNFNLVQKLLNPDNINDDKFGGSVAMCGDGTRVIIGSQRPDAGGSGNGAAYIFRFDTGAWVLEQKLTSADGSAGHRFGFYVAMSQNGERVAITAPYANYQPVEASVQNGAVYIFNRTGNAWSQVQKTGGLNTTSTEHYGYIVSMSASGQQLAVSTIQRASYRGETYIYEWIDGQYEQTNSFFPVEAAAWDMFGKMLTFSPDGSELFASSPLRNGYTGAVYIYE